MIIPLLIHPSWAQADDSSDKTQMKSRDQTTAKTIVIVGASYAAGWNPDKAVDGYRIVNKGANGQQSFEMLARFESDVVALKPKAVIIWGFINDVFRSDRDVIEQTLKRTRESLSAMVELARRAGIEPILATEVTIRPKHSWSEPFEVMIGKMLGKTSYQDYINGHVVQTNRWIRDFAMREGLPLLDFEMVLADKSSVRRKEFARADGSHISQEGYDALTQYSEGKIRNSLDSSR